MTADQFLDSTNEYTDQQLNEMQAADALAKVGISTNHVSLSDLDSIYWRMNTGSTAEKSYKDLLDSKHEERVENTIYIICVLAIMLLVWWVYRRILAVIKWFGVNVLDRHRYEISEITPDGGCYRIDRKTGSVEYIPKSTAP